MEVKKLKELMRVKKLMRVMKVKKHLRAMTMSKQKKKKKLEVMKFELDQKWVDQKKKEKEGWLVDLDDPNSQ